MNSNDGTQADERIRKLLEELDESVLFQRINEPIDRAVQGLDPSTTPYRSLGEFLDGLSRFVSRVHHAATGDNERLSTAEAKAETLFLLETAYRGGAGSGVFAAYLDSLEPQFDGFARICNFIAAEYTQRARSRYLHWLVTTLVDPLDWPTRSEMTAAVLEMLGPYLPDRSPHFDDASMPHALPALLSLLKEAEGLSVSGPIQSVP